MIKKIGLLFFIVFLSCVPLALAIENSTCLSCHEDQELAAFKQSVHAGLDCTGCHTDLARSDFPHKTPLASVDCANCHNQQVQQYQQSTHGKIHSQKNLNAPACIDCHGKHSILGKNNFESSTYPINIPMLCAKCHRDQGKAALDYKGKEHAIPERYTESIHGKGLLESGLIVTATCTSCHTAHKVLAAKEPESSVNRNNISLTCSQCHKGIYEKYIRSVHALSKIKTQDRLPVCSDCHSAHSIKRTDMDAFEFEIMGTCGKCHSRIAETYFQTFHGKATKLGFAKTAKCHDCHGSHEILPVSDPHSSLNRENIILVCQKCHPQATKNFASYLTHATHNDPKKYPWVFWTYWCMTALLVGTFAASGMHTLLWLPRSLQLRRAHPPKSSGQQGKQYVRFSLLNRILHAVMILSFLTLSITGMTLKFSYARWAIFISHILGGFEVSRFLHRLAAVALFVIFGIHIWDLLRRKRSKFGSWRNMLFGPNTMLFTLKDVREFIATIKWYMGKGERPDYGRWTYWEKFDYFAVFWGIAVIGLSGLTLWFAEPFTRILPGWLINVATIIHSDEALLAVGFIFTIHFFNTHFRPEKFPMDTVIFTGRVELEEFKREKPAEYEALVARGELAEHLADPLPEKSVRVIRIFAWLALAVGVSLIVCIIGSMIFINK